MYVCIFDMPMGLCNLIWVPPPSKQSATGLDHMAIDGVKDPADWECWQGGSMFKRKVHTLILGVGGGEGGIYEHSYNELAPLPPTQHM